MANLIQLLAALAGCVIVCLAIAFLRLRWREYLLWVSEWGRCPLEWTDEDQHALEIEAGFYRRDGR